MATNNQVGTNRIFDIHVVDLMDMDKVIPCAVLVDAHQWAENRTETARNIMNEAINNFRSAAEEMIFLHRTIGGNPNDTDDFSELYLGLMVNIGDGVGKDHPELYTEHPMGFSNNIVHPVAGLDTTDPVGTLARANRIRNGIKAHDNKHHHTRMITIAEQKLNHIAENIEYKDVENVVGPTDSEVNEAVDINRRSIKRQRLTPDRVIGMTFGDLQSMYDHAN
jgi:hypothetical protein